MQEGGANEREPAAVKEPRKKKAARKGKAAASAAASPPPPPPPPTTTTSPPAAAPPPPPPPPPRATTTPPPPPPPPPRATITTPPPPPPPQPPPPPPAATPPPPPPPQPPVEAAAEAAPEAAASPPPPPPEAEEKEESVSGEQPEADIMVKTIGDLTEFRTELANAGGKLIVIDFSATWCGPCKMIKPFFHSLIEKYPNVVFVEVDVDDAQDVASHCDVKCMPTFQFYKDNEKVHEFSGANKEKLEETIKKYM